MKIRDLDIVFHVGYHKTGTTFFQQQVFNKNDNILYLGRSWVHEKLNTYFYDFSFQHTFDFNPDLMEKKFYDIVENYVEQNNVDITKKKMILISHESLHSGSDYFGTKIIDQANRIKKVFPNARIIISVRNQLKMIESHYTNYIHHGGKLSFNTFFNNSYSFNNGLKSKLKYDQMVLCYFDLFKAKNVHVLVFEHVFSNQSVNLTQLAGFLNIKEFEIENKKVVNKRLSKLTISLIRLANKLLAKDFVEQYNNRLKGKILTVEKYRWYLIRVFKKIEQLKLFPKRMLSYNYATNKQKESITVFYKASNIELGKLIHIKLEKYDY